MQNQNCVFSLGMWQVNPRAKLHPGLSTHAAETLGKELILRHIPITKPCVKRKTVEWLQMTLFGFLLLVVYLFCQAKGKPSLPLCSLTTVSSRFGVVPTSERAECFLV